MTQLDGQFRCHVVRYVLLLATNVADQACSYYLLLTDGTENVATENQKFETLSLLEDLRTSLVN